MVIVIVCLARFIVNCRVSVDGSSGITDSAMGVSCGSDVGLRLGCGIGGSDSGIGVSYGVGG